jgi:hypothetical protein
MKKHSVLIGSLTGSAGAVVAFLAGMYLGEQRTLQHFHQALRNREVQNSSIIPASFEAPRSATAIQSEGRRRTGLR